jgi:hypothetical protein
VARRGTTTTKENRSSFSLIFTILKSISSREKMYTRATNETFPSIKTYNLIRRKVIREGHNSRTDQSHTHTHTPNWSFSWLLTNRFRLRFPASNRLAAAVYYQVYT